MAKNKFQMGAAKVEKGKERAQENEVFKEFSMQALRYDQLEISSRSKFSRDHARDIADSIKENGLFHNLLVCKDNKTGKYEILSGNTRYEAIGLLVKEKYFTQDHKIPCQVLPDNLSDIDKDIIIESANAKSRHNEEEFNNSVLRLLALVEQKNRELGIKAVPTKQVAEKLDISQKKVQRIQNIEKNLIEPLKKRYLAGEITQQAVLGLCGMTKEAQEVAYLLMRDTENVSKAEIDRLKDQAKSLAKEKEEELNKAKEAQRKAEAENATLKNTLTEKEAAISSTEKRITEIKNQLEDVKTIPQIDNSKELDLQRQLESAISERDAYMKDRDVLKNELAKKDKEVEDLIGEYEQLIIPPTLTEEEKRKQTAQHELELIAGDIKKSLTQYIVKSQIYSKEFTDISTAIPRDILDKMEELLKESKVQ